MLEEENTKDTLSRMRAEKMLKKSIQKQNEHILGISSIHHPSTYSDIHDFADDAGVTPEEFVRRAVEFYIMNGEW